MEWKVYILWSDKKRTYTGCAQDEIIRLQRHNNGEVKATKNHRPWEIVYVEQVGDYQSARKREKYYKSSAGRRKIKTILKDSKKTE